jgi:hypothetical protein
MYASWLMLKTTARCRLIPRLSVLLANWAWKGAEYLIRSILIKNQTSRNKDALVVQGGPGLVRRCINFVVYQGTMIMLGALGAAAGTVVYPGKGTVVGIALGEGLCVLIHASVRS